MRKSIYIEGLAHGQNPIPAACLYDKLLTSGAIFGTVRETGKIPETDEEQCRLMFDNARRILEAAGGGWDNVCKMTFYINPEVSRALINEEWVKAFPDSDSRPARHVMVNPNLTATMRMQCDLIAILV